MTIPFTFFWSIKGSLLGSKLTRTEFSVNWTLRPNLLSLSKNLREQDSEALNKIIPCPWTIRFTVSINLPIFNILVSFIY